MEESPPLLVYDQIDGNRRRSKLLLFAFGVVLLPFAFYLAHQVTAVLAMLVLPIVFGWERVMEDPALTIAFATFVAIQIVVVTVYLMHRRAAARILRVAHAHPPTPEQAATLERVVENLSIGAGLPPPRLAVIDSLAINAFSTGLSPEDSTLAVTRGALEALERRELEGIVAHELSQIGNHDTHVATIVAGFAPLLRLTWTIVGAVFRGLSGLLRAMGATPSVTRGCLVALALWIGAPIVLSLVVGLSLSSDMLRDDPKGAVLLFVLMTIPIYFLVVSPAAGILMVRASSRERIHRADADAVLLTRLPAGLACALAKMFAAGNAELPVSPATAPLYVADPLRASRPWAHLTATHPRPSDRLETVCRMGGVTPSMLEEASEAGLRFWEMSGEQ